MSYSTTTAHIAPPAPPKAPYKLSPLRIGVVSLMLFAIVALCLYLHHTALPAMVEGLTDGEHKSTAWIVGQVSFMLPFILICLFQYAVYAKGDRHDGILQREMAWEILIVAVLTYGVLLPVVWHVSDAWLALELAAGAVVEKTEGREYATLMMSLAEWFIRLAVPLLVLYVFHGGKAKAEMQPLCG